MTSPKYDEQKYPWIWKRESSSGYGFTARIPCRIIRILRKRVQIAASLKDGTERIHLVSRKSLEHSPCHCFAGCVGMETEERRLAKVD